MLIDPQSEKYYWTGGHEPDLQMVLSDILEPGSIFWDIGAHIGFFTLQAARAVGASGTVIAFEPMPDNRRRLNWNLRANDLAATVLAEAVSGGSGTLPIYSVGGSSLMWTLDQAAGDQHGGIVPVTTLDQQLLERRATPDLVKIDAERQEVNVLQGAKALVALRHTQFLIEFTNDALLAEGRRLLEGYELVPLGDGHWLARPDP